MLKALNKLRRRVCDYNISIKLVALVILLLLFSCKDGEIKLNNNDDNNATEFTVTFNLNTTNETALPIEPMVVPKGTSISVIYLMHKANKISDKKYFVGWNINPKSNTHDHDLTITKNTELFAVWAHYIEASLSTATGVDEIITLSNSKLYVEKVTDGEFIVSNIKNNTRLSEVSQELVVTYSSGYSKRIGWWNLSRTVDGATVSEVIFSDYLFQLIDDDNDSVDDYDYKRDISASYVDEIITEEEELRAIECDNPDISYALDNNIKLGRDLVIGKKWEPLCSVSQPFRGLIAGNGYLISNLSYDDDLNTHYNIGLFSSISGIKDAITGEIKYAEIFDVKFSNMNFVVKNSAKSSHNIGDNVGVNIGILAGSISYTKVHNIIFSGNISNTDGNDDTLKDIGNDYTHIGSIAGVSFGSIVKNNTLKEIKLNSSKSDEGISSLQTSIGGVVGSGYSNIIIGNSISKLVVAPNLNTSHIDVELYLGGLYGRYITNTGYSNVQSSIAGNYLQSNSLSGMARGVTHIGGLIGNINTADDINIEKNTILLNSVKVVNDDDIESLVVGGLVGKIGATSTGATKIMNNIFSGKVDISEPAEGNVHDEYLIGGLVGDANMASISKCYTDVHIKMLSDYGFALNPKHAVGGLVGRLGGDSELTNSVVVGEEITVKGLSGRKNIHRIVGIRGGAGATMNKNYVNFQSSVNINDYNELGHDKLEGYDTNNMEVEPTDKDEEIFYIDELQWDFDNIWRVASDEDSEHPYPVLIK